MVHTKTAMYSLLTGIPDCNDRILDRHLVEESRQAKVQALGLTIRNGTDPIESFQVTTFAINEKTYTVTHSTTAADEEEAIAPTVQTMDVAPYIKEGSYHTRPLFALLR